MGKNNQQLLFEKYKVYKDEEAFVELYSSIEFLLKKTITDVTYIFGPNIKKQKYSKIHKYELTIGKMISMATSMENYKEEYIRQIGYEDYDRYTNSKYTLIYPFWELINELSVEKTLSDMASSNITFGWYLATKFCDRYWLHIERCLRRDLSKHKRFKKISYEEFIECKTDSFYYENRLFTELDALIYEEELIEGLKKILTNREKEVLNLLLLGCSHNQISQELQISGDNSFKIKSSIYSKFKELIKKYC